MYVQTDARLDHAALICSVSIEDQYRYLLEFYSDQDGSRMEYIKYLGGLKCENPSNSELMMDPESIDAADAQHLVTLRFYDRLKTLKESFSVLNTANLPQTTSQLAEVYNPPQHFEKWALIESMSPVDSQEQLNLLLTGRDKGPCKFFTSSEHGGTIMDMDRLYQLWCNMPKYRGYKEVISNEFEFYNFRNPIDRKRN